MPMFLDPDSVRFELRDGRPVLRLAVELAAPPPREGWSLLSRTTLCLVDGPDDLGFVFPRLPAAGADNAPAGWDDAVQRAGGSSVALGAGPDAPTVFARSHQL